MPPLLAVWTAELPVAAIHRGHTVAIFLPNRIGRFTITVLALPNANNAEPVFVQKSTSAIPIVLQLLRWQPRAALNGGYTKGDRSS